MYPYCARKFSRHTRCDKLLRHVAATVCCNKLPCVTCENHCRCDRISSLRSVAQIQTGLNSCDISQRQTKRKRLVAAAVQTRRRVAAICLIVCFKFQSVTMFSLYHLRQWSPLNHSITSNRYFYHDKAVAENSLPFNF